MSLLTVLELRARVETHVGDGDLQSLIDNIEAEIVERIGAAYVDDETFITEEHWNNGRHLYLKRKILTVETVTEYASITDAGRELTVGYDFSIKASQGMLERVGNWGWKVVVEYLPTDDRRKWKEAVIDLARIDLARSPMMAESVAGEMSYTSPESWERERSRIFQRLMFTDF